MASLAFGGGRPESVQATGYLTDTGVDELASVIIKYPGTSISMMHSSTSVYFHIGNRVAQLCFSINLKLLNNAQVCGSKGHLTLLNPFWCPTQLQTPSETLDFPLPNQHLDMIFPNSQGLA